MFHITIKGNIDATDGGINISLSSRAVITFGAGKIDQFLIGRGVVTEDIPVRANTDNLFNLVFNHLQVSRMIIRCRGCHVLNRLVLGVPLGLGLVRV